MNEFASTAMWAEATADHDAEQRRGLVVRAKVALAGTWPFLAAAQSEEEFEHRLALMQASIEAQTPPVVLAEVVAGLRRDWADLSGERAAEAAQLRTAALTVTASDKGESPKAYVHVHKHGSGDDEYYQIDHVASPTWIKTLSRAGSREEALQQAREFGLPVGLPIYENGRHVEGSILPPVQASEEFFHPQLGRWVAAKGGMTYHESYGEVSRPQLAAYRSHNVPPAQHDELEEYFGKGMHDAITNYVKRKGRNGLNYGDVFRDRPDENGNFEHDDEDYGSDGMGRWGSKRALFTPDPTDAWRYSHYPPTPASPAAGGDVVAPGDNLQASRPGAPNQVGPDGFPIDVATGEGRSEIGYANQLTPGVWSVPPDAAWPQRPNAGRPGTPPVNASRHQATEGAVPTPGPNPDYFSTGRQGLQGPPVFPQDPADEPHVANPFDDFYGGVPPQASSGSAQNQVDGQGYSRMGARGRLGFSQGPLGRVQASGQGGVVCTNGNCTRYHWAAGDGKRYGLPDEHRGPVIDTGRLPVTSALEGPKFRVGDRVLDGHGEGATVHAVFPSEDPGKSHRVQVRWDDPERNLRWDGTEHPQGAGDERAYYEHVFRPHPDEAGLGRYVDEAVPYEREIARAYAHRRTANKYIERRGDGWVILQKGTGKVLSHHDSQEEAQASFRAMEANKHGSRTGAADPTVHIQNFMDWANTHGHDPDELSSLLAYERTPGIGRATTDQIADHYHLEGPEWRERARMGSRRTAAERRFVPPYVNGPEPERGSTIPCPQCGGYGGIDAATFGDRGWHPCYHCGTTGTVDAHGEWEQGENGRGYEHGSQGLAPEQEASAPYLQGHKEGFEGNKFHHYPDHYRVERDGQETYHSPAAQQHYRDAEQSGDWEDQFQEFPTRQAARTAGTNGQIVGHCDHCHLPVRWHDEATGGELRHLHNSSNRCSDGKKAKTASRVEVPQFFDPAELAAQRVASLPPAITPADGTPPVMPGADSDVPQPDATSPAKVSSRRTAEMTLQSPTPENPTGRGEDEYRARTWDALVKQRPMQTAEDRNINTPQLPDAPIRTRQINTPTPGLGESSDNTREDDDQDEEED
jgi:hypothetical protein